MAAFKSFITLTVCVLLGRLTFAINDAPCVRSKKNNGFYIFSKRHIRSGLPATLDDKSEWMSYIKHNGGCDRPTQSFLHPKELERVKAVCTNAGGATYKDNLCISRQPFTFVTVRSEPGTCGIRNIRQETKHLILACEVLENQCLPVHFEGNPENLKPSNNARGCQDPRIGGRASGLRMTWLPLLSALLLLVYCF